VAIRIRRRDFIVTLGSATAWPLAARAQQPKMPLVGFLHSTSPEPNAQLVASFRQGLRRAGYVEGQNVAIEYRWAEGHYDQLPALAAELVQRQVAVIAALGGQASGLAARAATSTVPIVFSSGQDPVKLGLVASFDRPGGNATGVSMLLNEMEAKRLGILHELVPAAATIAVLLNPSTPGVDSQSTDVQSAAPALGLTLLLLNAGSEREIDAAFTNLAQQRPGGLLVAASALFNSRRDQIIGLAARQAIPAMYEHQEFAMAGGLISYGINLGDVYRQVGVYAGRILAGVKPADLPVMQPTRFELLINLKTAKALGLTIPDKLLALADAVIE
jgi:putative ABC transport system substrate-binding protein